MRNEREPSGAQKQFGQFAPGATDIVIERGDAGVAKVKEPTRPAARRSTTEDTR